MGAKESDDLSDYDRLAPVYDRLWAASIRDRFWPVVREHVLPRLAPGAVILDLCCGPGAMTRALAAEGYAPIGVDGSSRMLELARAHAPELEFSLQRWNELRLGRSCDAALCLFDSLEHARSLTELREVLGRVSAALSRGPFLFDLNGEQGYRERWRGAANIVRDEIVLASRGTYDPSTRHGELYVTTFTATADGWQRDDMSFAQHCFEAEEVLSLLAELGFRNAQTFDAAAELGIRGEAGRIVYLCEKG